MSGLTPDAINKLQLFLGAVKKNPNIFYLPELKFFKDFVESWGGTIPPQSNASSDIPKSEPSFKFTPEPPQEEESEESDPELDNTGVIDNPDAEEPIPDVVTELEVSEENIDKSNDKKREAIHAYNDEKYEDAVKAYTEAIELNPVSALLYAKRGQSYLQLSKPNACIRDCSVALKINPDSAAAYKFRGRAYRLLGKWEDAAKDLRNAAKIDFDEQTDEWLKEVTPNARKLEEHQRKYERKRYEKELKEKQERIRKAREEQARAAPESEADFDFTGGPGGGMPPGFMDMFNDPELAAAFQDPEMISAFTDITSNPSNIAKYQNNPKVMKLLSKMSQTYGSMGGTQGFPGMGSFGGHPQPPPPSGGASKAGKGAPDDIGLD